MKNMLVAVFAISSLFSFDTEGLTKEGLQNGFDIRYRPSVFGSHPLEINQIAALDQWEGVSEALDDFSIEYCNEFCDQKDMSFFDVVQNAKKVNFVEALTMVNAHVNKNVLYRSDISQYGEIDKWAYPHDIIHKMAGDCEDYVILKMALLKEAGVPLERMTVVIVKKEDTNELHAVLSVSSLAGNIILDNLEKYPYLDKGHRKYVTLFSLNVKEKLIHGYKRV